MQLCTAYIKGDWVWSWLPSHGYILVGGIGYGFFETNLKVCGTGQVRNDHVTIYPPTNNPGAVPSGQNYAICTPVMIDDCCIDKAKYQQAIQDYINALTANPGSYTAGVRDCFTTQTAALDYAYANSGNGNCYLDQPSANPGAFVPSPLPKPKWKPKSGCDCK